MSIIAVAVKHLVAAGVTGDTLVMAIQEMEAQIETRSSAAIRQDRYRRNKVSQTVTSVTDDVTRYAVSPNGFSPPDGFPNPSLTPTSSLTPIKENPPKGGQKKVSRQEEIILPDWMPLSEWQGFKEMRVKIKKPMTARAEKLAIGKLDQFRAKGHDPTVILNQSIFNDYQDLYEPKERYENIRGYSSKPTFKSEGKRLADKYRADAEREEQAAVSRDVEPNLRIAESIRQDSG